MIGNDKNIMKIFCYSAAGEIFLHVIFDSAAGEIFFKMGPIIVLFM